MSDERIDQLERWREDMERRFAEAFPGGDHVGHCRYHQLMIEGIDAKKRLREAILQKTIAGLVWGAMIGLGLAVWQYIKSLLKG
jgi:hypothetical protein